MSKNRKLLNAKKAKNDEFYTQLTDIEKEMNAYLEYNPDVFRGKTILLPCDDPEWSNFTKFFASRVHDYGIKKLISTSFTRKHYMEDDTPDRGKIFLLDREDENSDGHINVEDLNWEYLQGDGDFRSDEIKALRDEADMVITNPPFSLFREFMAWLVEGDVEFAVIGNMNYISCKNIFPLIKDNSVWIGGSGMIAMVYQIPDTGELKGTQYRTDDGTRYQKMGNTCWFTNIQHGRRNEPLLLMTMDDNLCFNKRIINNPNSYKQYDNYDAIEVPVTAGIPTDYEGVMGVPISFLNKYNPEQFEILGISEQDIKGGSGDLWDRASGVNHPLIAGERRYTRIFIKHKRR